MKKKYDMEWGTHDHKEMMKHEVEIIVIDKE